jgi:hypothetical protein
MLALGFQGTFCLDTTLQIVESKKGEGLQNGKSENGDD